MIAVEARKLTKKYKNKTAVNGLDLTVNEGEIFGLLGVNGAGKTTTIRMMTCLSAPTSGEAFICGHSCADQKSSVKEVIGISPQDTAVAGNLTVRENLEFMGRVYGFDREKISSRTKEMIELFKMDDIENSRAKVLSGGYQRKLSIAMALISNPKVLFLDEPTLGLDVLSRRELWKAIESLKGKTTIILTTHYMEEAEQLCDRIGIMINGEIRAMGTVAELERISGKNGLENAFIEIAERGGNNE